MAYCSSCLKLMKQKEMKEEEKVRERRKLTAQLRFMILKRDNYRCCICGTDASDDVQLHVDHITPIKEGGLTTPTNLWTLCSCCNLGKGVMAL